MSTSWTHTFKPEAPVTVSEQTCYSGRTFSAGSFQRFAFLVNKKKVLCIPLTSASSEKNFSTAGNIMNEQRTCLKSDSLDNPEQEHVDVFALTPFAILYGFKD